MVFIIKIENILKNKKGIFCGEVIAKEYLINIAIYNIYIIIG